MNCSKCDQPATWRIDYTATIGSSPIAGMGEPKFFCDSHMLTRTAGQVTKLGDDK